MYFFTEIMQYWFFFFLILNFTCFLCHGWSSLLEYNFESGGKLCVNNFSSAEKFHPFSNWIFYYGPLKSQEHFDHQIVEHLHKKKRIQIGFVRTIVNWLLSFFIPVSYDKCGKWLAKWAISRKNCPSNKTYLSSYK